MTVLVAHLATSESAAALRAGVEEARRRGEDLLVMDLEDHGVTLEETPDVQVVVERCDPRQRDKVGGLLDAANRLDASVIVIGVRHRSATGKLLFGSIAQQILLDSTTPVLAVKP